MSAAIRGGAPAEELERLRAEAGARLAEAEELAARLRAISPRDASIDLPLETSPDELVRAALPPRTVLVEYAEGEGRVDAYVLGAGVLELVHLGSRAAISSEIERYLAAIGEPARAATPAEIARTGRALFERLLAPALAAAGGEVEGLVIVPSASLAALPFEALVVEGGADAGGFDELVFVIERWDLTYGPSSPVLVELARSEPRASAGRVLVLADPRYPSEGTEPGPSGALLASSLPRAQLAADRLERLPGTRAEALAIARALIGGGSEELSALEERRTGSLDQDRIELHLGDRASRARLGGDLRGFAALHLACHGHVDAEDPLRTGIALAPAEGDDGWFTIADALELDLDADLVVLSACQTARGEARAGEGVESLARAFLYAGARGLVASLWQVDDRAAARTMEGFYRAWLEQGLPPARALRAAKLALRRGELELGPARGVALEGSRARTALDAGHPFLWAPFVHVGLAR
jgi:CHAT domain-containing protein